jgi:hypothetical protein
MPRSHPVFASFTTGELSPLMYGRVDFAKYTSGLRTLLNYLIRPHGPAFRRPGTHFIAEVKDSSKFVRLIKFEFSTTQAYVIESGELYFRFFLNGGRLESPPGTPVEVTTPYLSSDLPSLKYVQSADTMYFAHPNYPVQKLQRTSATTWTMVPVNFLPPLTFESGYTPGQTLTLGATSGLAVAITVSAGGDLQAGDVGRMITSGNGRAIIKAVATPTTGTVDIVDTFASVGPIASGSWIIQGSSNAILTPTISQPAHASTTMTLGIAGWRAIDVGRYVRVNGGVVRITKFTSATVADGEILTTLSSITAAPSGSWSTEEPDWSAARGYPRAIALHEQRLILGGWLAKPQAFVGSDTGQYEVFALGPNDDDAYEFVIASNEVNTISWMLPSRVLLLGTAATEFIVQGSPGALNSAIGPNNVDVQATTFWGSSSTVQPLRIGNAGLFIGRPGTELREMIFSLQRDSYIADDLLLLAEHMTKGVSATITDIAYQRHPNSTIWAVRSDGALLSMAYQREHDVAGWARHITGPDMQDTTPAKGKFESVCVIPHWNGDRDVSFFVVNRLINGSQVRYVEYMDDLGGFYGNLGMDCALTYVGAPTTSVSGLTHLANETVKILGDGAVYPDAVVSAGGIVTLSGLPVTKAEIGLGFNSKLETMRVEVPQQGTSQGVQKHWAKIWVRVYKTLGMFIQGEEKPFRKAPDKMDQPPPIFSGDIQHEGTGLDRDGIITIEQRQPLPQIVCAIFGTLFQGD